MKHVKDKMIPAVLILVLLVIWEAAVDLLHIPLYVLPSPLEVVKALFTEGTELVSHGLTTVGDLKYHTLFQPGTRFHRPDANLRSGQWIVHGYHR